MTLQEQAKQLYITHSASEVAKQLGVSEPTIRRWVKGIKKPKSNKYNPIVQKVYEMATRPQGIGGSEERAMYKETYGFKKDDESGEIHVNITDSQKNYIRTQVRNKAEQKGKVALFVPDWVSLKSPRHSFNRMLQMTNDLYERMQEYISGYMVEFDIPKESRYAVEQQLLIMLVPKYSPRNIYDVCKQATDVVDILEQRKELKEKKTEPLTKEVTCVFDSMKDIGHFIY